MNNIFIGFLLVFLNFNLNLGNSTIGLFPDFIGYIVMINGLAEMAEESQLFLKVKPYAAGMAVYTGILYFIDFLGVSPSLGAFSYILAIVSTIISLYISYCVIMGVKETEEKHNTELNGDSLKSTWNILAVFHIAVYITLLFPPLAVICIIVAIIVRRSAFWSLSVSRKICIMR